MTMLAVSRGRELSHAIMKGAAVRASVIERKLGRPPTLAIIGAANAEGRRFVDLKQRRLANLRINIEPYWLTSDDTTDFALDVVAALNGRRDVDAVFLQFPLPDQIDGSQLANAIDPRKDIDCSGAMAEAQFLCGQSAFTPVAPLAASELLRDELGSLRGWRIVIAGSDDPFTGGLSALLRGAEAAVETAHAASPMMGKVLRHADALVVSDILPDPAALAQIEWLALLLDAGYYLRPRPHDWIPRDRKSVV